MDPISLHKYLYANGDPIMNADPTGLFSLTEQGVVSSINNFLATASKLHNIVHRVNNLIDAIDRITMIFQIAAMDWSVVIEQIKSRITPSSFKEYANRFTPRGIERALAALLDNGDNLIVEIAKHPQKISDLGAKLGGPNPAFVILLPSTPPPNNLLSGLPPIPTGLKLGRLRIPVFLSFGQPNHVGRFTGLSVAADHKLRGWDRNNENLENVFHMDYIVHAARMQNARAGNYAVWTELLSNVVDEACC